MPRCSALLPIKATRPKRTLGRSNRLCFWIQEKSSSKKKELDEDHWVSFVLDNFSTVADAVDAIRNEVHIVSVQGKKGYSYATPKHLAIADATGDSAIVEIQRKVEQVSVSRQQRS